MLTVTRVFCVYPATGVKTAVSPSTCQRPAICGERVGIGVLAASGAENWTLIGAAPLTFFASLAGVTDSTWIGVAGWTCRVSAAGCAPDTEAWLPSDPEATTATPTASTSTAPLAVSAAPRRFHRDRSGLPAEASPPSSNDCCLRNLPDRDTTPSLHLISQLDNRINANLLPGEPRARAGNNQCSTIQTRVHHGRLPPGRYPGQRRAWSSESSPCCYAKSSEYAAERRCGRGGSRPGRTRRAGHEESRRARPASCGAAVAAAHWLAGRRPGSFQAPGPCRPPRRPSGAYSPGPGERSPQWRVIAHLRRAGQCIKCSS